MKHSSEPRRDPEAVAVSPEPPAPVGWLPSQRDGRTCDLYDPGHLIHYRHQAQAVRSASVPAREVLVEDTRLHVELEDGRRLEWRHHDAVRLRQVLELVPLTRVVYPHQHALRVGTYWFNCAPTDGDWHECRLSLSVRS